MKEIEVKLKNQFLVMATFVKFDITTSLMLQTSTSASR